MGASLAVTLLMLIICTNTVITDGKENRPQGFQVREFLIFSNIS